MISLVVERSGVAPERHEDLQLPLVIGREAGVDLVVPSALASREHARIQADAGACILLDLDSSNGTYRNGKRIQRAALAQGDTLGIGNATVTIIAITNAEREKPAVPGFRGESELACGVQSEIWNARQEALGRAVVLRLLRPEHRPDQELRALFDARVRSWTQLEGAGLARVLERGEDDAVGPWVAAEVLEGEPAPVRVARNKGLGSVETLALTTALLSLAEKAEAAGVSFGLIAPDSLFLEGRAAELRVQVASCGFPLPLSRSSEEPAWLVERTFLPPEALEAGFRPDRRSDLFVIGALAHWALSGQLPREGQHEAEILAAVPAGLGEDALGGKALPTAAAELLASLTAVDPAERPSDTSELRERAAKLTEKLAADRSAVAEARDGEAPRQHWKTKSKWKIINGLISLVILVGLNGAFFWWFLSLENDDSPADEADDGVFVASPPEPGPQKPPREPLRKRFRNDDLPDLRERIAALSGKARWSAARATIEAAATAPEDTAVEESLSDLMSQLDAAQNQAADQLVSKVEEHLEKSQLREASKEYARAREALRALDREAEAQPLEVRLSELRTRILGTGSGSGASGAGSGGPGGSGAANPGAAVSPDEGEGGDKGDSGSGGPGGTANPAAGSEAPSAAAIAARNALWANTLSGEEGEGARAARQALLRDGAHAAAHPGRVAVLAALTELEEQVAQVLSAQVGKQLRLPLRDGTTLVGELEAAQADGLRILLSENGESRTVGCLRVTPARLLRMVKDEEPTERVHLARAVLHLQAGQPDEAWFDREAALVLIHARGGPVKAVRAALDAPLERARNSR